MPFINHCATLPSLCLRRMSDLPSPLMSATRSSFQPVFAPQQERPVLDRDAVHLPHVETAVGVLDQRVGLAVAVEIALAHQLPTGVRAFEVLDGAIGRAVHGPHHHASVGMLPRDVGLAVAGVVGKLANAPLGAVQVRLRRGRQSVHRPDRGAPRLVEPHDVLFAVAVEIREVEDDQPLFAPTNWLLPVMVVPFISQTFTLPSSWRHRRSDLPSPLKSATCVTDHPDAGPMIPPLPGR
jgi:hypothetical protein